MSGLAASDYVAFHITSGPDKGYAQNVYPNLLGNAVFSFTNGGKAGEDTIRADIYHNYCYPLATCWAYVGSKQATVSFTDTIAPTVSSETPSAVQANVYLDTDVTATFSEKMDPATITASTFKLYQWNKKKKKWQQLTDVNVGCVNPSSCTQAKLNPYASDSSKVLKANTKYKVLVTTAAEDINGNAIDQDTSKNGSQPMVWTFTTGSSLGAG